MTPLSRLAILAWTVLSMSMSATPALWAQSGPAHQYTLGGNGADLITLRLQPGGEQGAGRIGGIGWISTRPNIVLEVQDEGSIRIEVASDSDPTLLVRLPDGSVLSNDDSEGLNPALTVRGARAGRYEVFVGTYNAGALFDADVVIAFEKARESGTAGPATASASGWSASDYARYRYEDFRRLPQAQSRVDFDAIDLPLLHAAVFYETNRQRASLGLPRFRHAPGLELSSYNHSSDMRRLSFFSHSSPVRGREQLSDRINEAGFAWSGIAENIAITFGIEYETGRGVFNPDQNGGYFSYEYRGDPIQAHSYVGLAEAVLEQWMNSPGHRANIANTNYTHLGAGAAFYEDSSFYGMPKFYFTQNFGRQR